MRVRVRVRGGRQACSAEPGCFNQRVCIIHAGIAGRAARSTYGAVHSLGGTAGGAQVFRGPPSQDSTQRGRGHGGGGAGGDLPACRWAPARGQQQRCHVCCMLPCVTLPGRTVLSYASTTSPPPSLPALIPHARTPESLGAADVERTYCFAAGSYRRGEPESGDIDILVSPPPSLARTPAASLLAQVCVGGGRHEHRLAWAAFIARG